MRIARTMAYVALAAAWMIPAGAAMAGKPSGGGGSTGGGTIWYQIQGDTRYWTMNSDGSGKAPAPTGANFRFSTHGGHRWYVNWNRIGAETYPNGNPRIEAFAVRDDGVSVQLTDQADLQRRGYVNTEWTPDGQRFAWIARRFVNGVVADGGLYVAALSFDASGNVVGLASQPTSPAFARALDANAQPDISGVSWSPDGSQFAYDNAGGIDIADLSGNDRVLVAVKPGIAGSVYPSGPQWSPAGTSILYFESHSGAWYVTSPSGGSGTKLIHPSTSTHIMGAFWSPTASHVVYTEESNFQPGGPAAIYRINSNGGSATLLTSGITWSQSVAWTQ